jgi:ribulose kinase
MTGSHSKDSYLLGIDVGTGSARGCIFSGWAVTWV